MVHQPADLQQPVGQTFEGGVLFLQIINQMARLGSQLPYVVGAVGDEIFHHEGVIRTVVIAQKLPMPDLQIAKAEIQGKACLRRFQNGVHHGTVFHGKAKMGIFAAQHPVLIGVGQQFSAGGENHVKVSVHLIGIGEVGVIIAVLEVIANPFQCIGGIVICQMAFGGACGQQAGHRIAEEGTDKDDHDHQHHNSQRQTQNPHPIFTQFFHGEPPSPIFSIIAQQGTARKGHPL